jgi:hypothetical protein
MIRDKDISNRVVKRPAQPIVRRYADVRTQIRDGDLLSFRPRPRWWRPWEYATWLIALTNRQHICHSAMAAWWHGNLMLVQMTSSPDRIIRISEVVKRWPGKCIVSRAVPKSKAFSRDKAVEVMIRIAGRKYGWWRLFFMGLAHTLLGRRLAPRSNKDFEKSKWPPVCSQAVSMATRAAGDDPCPHMADRSTEPADLYESKFFKPMYILV